MSNKFYKTCRHCGSNLDPNEFCDCQSYKPIPKGISESYTVGVDISGLGDTTTIVITNSDGSVISEFIGEEAERLYRHFTGVNVYAALEIERRRRIANE